MPDIAKKCLHCGTPMQTQRSTKKYCSDTCKQAAFYNRITQPQLTLNDKETIKAIDFEGEEMNEDHIDDPNTVEQESFNNEQLPVEMPFNASRYVRNYDDTAPPIPFNVRKPTNQHTIPEPYHAKHQEEDNIKVNAKRYHDTEVEEDPYEWVRSELLDDIADYVQDNYRTTEMFQYPKKYWYGSDLEKVKWVSVRFLSIIENLLHFNNSTVERRTFVALNKAIKAMQDSWNYKYMPYNYPLKNEIRQQQQTIEKIAKSGDRSFRFGLKRETKVKLIALRFQLADLVPRVKFKNLDFSK
jgi:hypothetical protein